ncbi:hypothetical protein [Streptomyces sp. NPDC059781]|uniref:hypothetical protein n=1 Tax=Streptomyces sp. NPDC059781 TaxID=3346943 RepID=UPI003647E05D
MSEKDGGLKPRPQPDREPDETSDRKPDEASDRKPDETTEREQRRGPNYWAAASFLINLWRFIRDW